mgnify:CR=1 FL=1|tara:strand:- start:4992 stop:5303 length:312 start_codon:yes stop_codon:yes gene_type:complete
MKLELIGKFNLDLGEITVKRVSSKNVETLKNLIISGSGIYWENRKSQYERFINSNISQKYISRWYYEILSNLFSYINDNRIGELTNWTPEQLNQINLLKQWEN